MSVLLRSSLKSINTWHAIGFIRSLAFKSDLSPEVLFPKSKPQLYTPSPPPPSVEKFNGYIPMQTLKITYSRSSGPGGQNVNKLDTKVDLRFHVDSADWIPGPIRSKLATEYKNQINKEGYFVIKSDLTRYQSMNLADALEKVRNLIRKVEAESEVKEVEPETKEKHRRRQEKAARERLFKKRGRSDVKANRQA